MTRRVLFFFPLVLVLLLWAGSHARNLKVATAGGGGGWFIIAGGYVGTGWRPDAAVSAWEVNLHPAGEIAWPDSLPPWGYAGRIFGGTRVMIVPLWMLAGVAALPPLLAWRRRGVRSRGFDPVPPSAPRPS